MLMRIAGLQTASQAAGHLRVTSTHIGRSHLESALLGTYESHRHTSAGHTWRMHSPHAVLGTMMDTVQSARFSDALQTALQDVKRQLGRPRRVLQCPGACQGGGQRAQARLWSCRVGCLALCPAAHLWAVHHI